LFDVAFQTWVMEHAFPKRRDKSYFTYGFKDGVKYRKWDNPVFSVGS